MEKKMFLVCLFSGHCDLPTAKLWPPYGQIVASRKSKILAVKVTKKISKICFVKMLENKKNICSITNKQNGKSLKNTTTTSYKCYLGLIIILILMDSCAGILKGNYTHYIKVENVVKV